LPAEDVLAGGPYWDVSVVVVVVAADGTAFVALGVFEIFLGDGGEMRCHGEGWGEYAAVGDELGRTIWILCKDQLAGSV